MYLNVLRDFFDAVQVDSILFCTVWFQKVFFGGSFLFDATFKDIAREGTASMLIVCVNLSL